MVPRPQHDRPRTYLDNAATSFPKPPCVAEAMSRFASGVGASPGRGAYAESLEAAAILARGRRAIARLLNADDPNRIIFTLNCSDALNLAIKGLVRHAARTRRTTPHVVTTEMDHNSVLRPLRAMEDAGECAVTRVASDSTSGRVDPDDIRRAIRADTILVATHHASNVSGTLQPIEPMAQLCRERAVPFLLDAAQTLGHVPLDVRALGIDLVAFPGHKGLLGPLGTGGLYIAPGLEARIDPLREGGTGSRSELDVQPDDLPDRFEPGSHNAIGLAGLGAAVEWILDRSVASLETHARTLSRVFLEELDGPRVLGPHTAEERVPVFAMTVGGLSPHDAAAILESEFAILARAGLHCAPLAHRTFGTLPDGALRLSFGAFNSEDQARTAARALREIAAEAGAMR